MISTLKYLYTGDQDLFHGLEIEKYLDLPIFQPHPVIHIDMSRVSTGFGIDTFNQELINVVNDIADEYDVEADKKSSAGAFGDIITGISRKHKKPVILVDEYDFPLSETFYDIDYQKEIWEILRDFYIQIKGHCCDIHIAYLTGISKLTMSGIIAAINNFHDCSDSYKFCTMFGFTHNEILENFKEYIIEIAKKKGVSKEEILKKK
jgi:hypothetical protein